MVKRNAESKPVQRQTPDTPPKQTTLADWLGRAIGDIVPQIAEEAARRAPQILAAKQEEALDGLADIPDLVRKGEGEQARARLDRSVALQSIDPNQLAGSVRRGIAEGTRTLSQEVLTALNKNASAAFRKAGIDVPVDVRDWPFTPLSSEAQAQAEPEKATIMLHPPIVFVRSRVAQYLEQIQQNPGATVLIDEELVARELTGAAEPSAEELQRARNTRNQLASTLRKGLREVIEEKAPQTVGGLFDELKWRYVKGRNAKDLLRKEVDSVGDKPTNQVLPIFEGVSPSTKLPRVPEAGGEKKGGESQVTKDPTLERYIGLHTESAVLKEREIEQRAAKNWSDLGNMEERAAASILGEDERLKKVNAVDALREVDLETLARKKGILGTGKSLTGPGNVFESSCEERIAEVPAQAALYGIPEPQFLQIGGDAAKVATKSLKMAMRATFKDPDTAGEVTQYGGVGLRMLKAVTEEARTRSGDRKILSLQQLETAVFENGVRVVGDCHTLQVFTPSDTQ